MEKIKIIIADDHKMFIDGLKLLLAQHKKVIVIGEALNGKKVLELLSKKKADMILMDINMPDMDGVEATRLIRKQFPEVKILALTMYNTKEFIAQLLAAGVSGYILKNTGQDELLKAIDTIHAGENFFSEAVTKRIMESMQGKRTSKYDLVIELTKREKQLLKLIVEEHTSDEIAKELFLSLSTIESYRKNLISKLGVRNTAGLVRYAIEHGVMEE